MSERLPFAELHKEAEASRVEKVSYHAELDLHHAQSHLRGVLHLEAEEFLEELPPFPQRVGTIQSEMQIGESPLIDQTRYTEIEAGVKDQREEVWKELRQAACETFFLRRFVNRDEIMRSIQGTQRFEQDLREGGMLSEWGWDIYLDELNRSVAIHTVTDPLRPDQPSFDVINLDGITALRREQVKGAMKKFYDVEMDRIALSEASRHVKSHSPIPVSLPREESLASAAD